MEDGVLTMGWYPLTGTPRPLASPSGGNPAYASVHQEHINIAHLHNLTGLDAL